MGATSHVSNASCLNHKGIAQVIQVTSYIYLFLKSLVQTNFEPSCKEGRKLFPFDLTQVNPQEKYVSRF